MPPCDAPTTEETAHARGFVSVGAHRLRLLRDGNECYSAMLAAIASAKREICLEMYWFGSDMIGQQFVDALAARAREGITVRVIYDAFGSRPLDERLFEPLRQAGGDVRPFGPWSSLLPRGMRWFRRDHRKILVCDGEVGFTGGLNIGREWAAVWQGGGGWRDDMVEAAGPVAGELRAIFYWTWRRLLHRRERNDPARMPPDVAPQRKKLRSRIDDALQLRRRRGQQPLAAASKPESERDVWAISRHRRAVSREIRATYLRWIRSAQTSIEIVNPYFVPDAILRHALVRAARRGVRVRILVPKHSDVPLVQWAVEHVVERLAAEGIEIYAYKNRVLHAKRALFDDLNATVGSYNLDTLSFAWNLEVNLGIRSREMAAVMREAFERDIQEAERWTAESLAARGWFRKALGAFAMLFAKIL